MSFPQSIMGKHGWEKLTTSAQKHKLGTHMQIADREFIYAQAGEAITVGKLVMGAAGTAVKVATSSGPKKFVIFPDVA